MAERLDVPAALGSGQPRLQVAGDSAVWLSWGAPADSGDALRYAARMEGTWSKPTTVASGADWFVNWADLPSVVPLPSGRAAAHYLESNGASPLAYAVRVTQRSAAGTWHAPVTPHADSTQTEHGFVSMLPWPEDRLLAVWLDGRKMGGPGHGTGDMTLRGALLGPEGIVERRAQVDGRTCECCATSAVRVGDEALVAYRGRSADEVRDIRLVRFDGAAWSAPTRLHDDGWQIEGCPVNGPALAAAGDRVAAAWFTAADGRPRVRAAFSTDGGRRFSDPIEVAAGTPRGRVDVALLSTGAAAISWLDMTETGGAVRARLLSLEGETHPPVTLARVSSSGREVGFPKMVSYDNTLYVAWVQPNAADGASRVQMARAPIDRLR